MKAILISIKPKWVAKILNGEKTIEVRKTCPTQLRGDTPIKPEPIDVYIYCTKDKQNMLHKNCINIYWCEDSNFKATNKKLGIKTQPYFNGKVVAKFTLNKVEDVRFIMDYHYGGHYNIASYSNEKAFERDCCLSLREIDNYINKDNLYKRDKIGYAWHIDNLVIFDKPKELSEFKVKRKINECSGCKYLDTDTYEHCINCEEIKPLTKAPQSYMYVEVENE